MVTVVESGPTTLTLVEIPPSTLVVEDSPNTVVIVENALLIPGLPRQVAQVTLTLLGGQVLSTIPFAIGYRVYEIQTSIPARVRLYDTVAHQTADLPRTVYIDPPGGSGVVLDVVTADSTLFPLSPQVLGASLESVPSVDIPMTVTATATGLVTVTVTWVRTE